MNKIPSGIEGFDKLLYGGFPKGRAYLVAGEPGTGKTTFCLQYLISGAKLGEKGIFVSIDEKPDQIIHDAEALGWDIKSYLETGLIQIIDVTNYFGTSKVDSKEGINIHRVTEDILSYVKKSNASRLAIDPVAPLVFAEQKIPEVAEYIRNLTFTIENNTGCTTLMTSFIPVGAVNFSQHGIEEFVASGIIILRLQKIENKFIRTIGVRKIRGSRIDLSEYSFEILPQRGIVLRQPI
jgi:circadian clock protein KaiC